MIGTANAIILDSAKIKRRQTMLTVGADQTNLAVAGAEQHQIFAQQPYSERLASRRGQ
jgi:hypothetical protein